MNLYIFSSIVAIVIIALLIVTGYNYYKNRKARLAICALLSDAINEFQSLCNPSRLFSDDEVSSYVAKHHNLYSSITSIGDKRVNRFYECYYAKNRRKTDIATQFINCYNDIIRLQSSNNLAFNNIAICNDKAEVLYLTLKSKFPDTPEIGDYFTSSECQRLLSDYKPVIDALNSAFPRYKEFLSFPNISELHSLLLNLEKNRLSYNHTVYNSRLLEENKIYFDTILPYPLDIQQRTAIVTDEDNTLVISSAGSGKTSTIIGKARYLIDKRHVDPSKLLILTYTRKAAAELTARLGNSNINCSTFHSLAFRILANLENKKPSICEPSLMLNVFHKLLKTDPKFLAAILKYILHLQSLMKLEHDYNSAPTYFADRKKYGIQAPYPDMKGNIIFTKSEEEKRICTFLTELGVDFLYEEPYPITTYTTDFRQYKPDFTIFVNKYHVDPLTGVQSVVKQPIFLEHFAIDANGNVPKWFGDKDNVGGWYAQNTIYKKGILWKRQTHASNGTILLETTSADFHSGRILEVLKQQLLNAGVVLNPPTPEELYARLVKRSRKIENSVFKLLEQFIALLKSNCGSIQPFIDKAITVNDQRTVVILQDVIKPLFNAYSAELQRRGEIDYFDAIIRATNYCASGYWHQYDYILVDEFQDISIDRYHFLQYLRSQNSLTKLFCVGDDWQSIFRFAGSDMKLFYKFEEFFGFTELCKIEITYRLFNPLLDISSDFIQRNPEQIKKNVKSAGKPMPPVAPEDPFMPTQTVDIDGRQLRFLASDIPDVHEWLRKYHTSFHPHDCGNSQTRGSMLAAVQSIVETIPENESILLLGRYNYDAKSLGYDTDNHDFYNNHDPIEVVIAQRKITFMSVHSAKGLEADNVIIINCNEGIYGFPSLVEDDPILSYVLSEDDQYIFAEERRLFYVALTRAKRHLHILYNGDKPSPFVRELTPVLKSNEFLCPVCQDGHVVVIKRGRASNGIHFTNYGCSNSNAGCDYFERVFGNDVPRFVTFNKKQTSK